jgi:hypothetical protein
VRGAHLSSLKSIRVAFGAVPGPGGRGPGLIRAAVCPAAWAGVHWQHFRRSRGENLRIGGPGPLAPVTLQARRDGDSDSRAPSEPRSGPHKVELGPPGWQGPGEAPS